MVCSFMMDQQFWGNQVRRLGVGTRVAFRKLDDKTLHGHLGRLLAPGFAERARRLGDVVRSESPAVPRAADLIEKAVAARSTQSSLTPGSCQEARPIAGGQFSSVVCGPARGPSD